MSHAALSWYTAIYSELSCIQALAAFEV